MGELDRVFDGGYAEYALVPNRSLYTIETDLDWADLAAVPETYSTAFGAMKNLKSKLKIGFWFGLDQAVLVRPLPSWCAASFQTWSW